VVKGDRNDIKINNKESEEENDNRWKLGETNNEKHM
jgi:hypothetical protein